MRAALTWLLVISGVGGDPTHRQEFVDQSLSLVRAAQERFGLADDQVTYLAERAELAPGVARGRSTAVEIGAAFERIAASAAPDDQVIVVLIGHGSPQGEGGRFALPGPDMGPEAFAPLLASLGARRLAFINTASSSGGFLSLASPGRVVITATRNPRERERTLFGAHFVAALVSGDADTDKDQRISMLEAFRYAVAEVARVYEGEGRLQTEHALLDDDGDGEGSATPGEEAPDGALAALVAFGLPLAVPAADAAADPELQSLLARRASLQADLDALRARRDEIEEEAYLDELEELLVEIAAADAAIRAHREESQ